MKVLDIPQPWRERAVLTADSPVPAAWFSEEELREAEAFRLARRRAEYLQSRAAAKHLALALGITADAARCRIERRRIGAFYLSLSHSGVYSAAAIDRQPVGIDVQVVRPLRESAGHLFLTGAETEAMQSLRIDDRLIHFWCAKEAAWKQRGGEIETLKRVPLTLEGETPTGLRFSNVETVRIGELVLALTRPIS